MMYCRPLWSPVWRQKYIPLWRLLLMLDNIITTTILIIASSLAWSIWQDNMNEAYCITKWLWWLHSLVCSDHITLYSDQLHIYLAATCRSCSTLAQWQSVLYVWMINCLLINTYLEVPEWMPTLKAITVINIDIFIAHIYILFLFFSWPDTSWSVSFIVTFFDHRSKTWSM